MTIKYRKIDGEGTQKNAAVSNALQAEHAAYAAELELERLKAVGADADQTTAQRREAQHHRKLAIGATSRAKVPRAAITELRRNFVGDWLEKIEGDHADRAAKLADCEAALAIKSGPGVLDEDGRERTEIIRDRWRQEVADLEKVHAVAAGRWDALQGKKPKAKKGEAEEPPAEG